MHPWKRSTWDSGAWRPDLRASFGVAAAAALLVMAGFAALFSAAPRLRFSQRAVRTEEQLIFIPEPLPPRALHPRVRPRASTAHGPTVRSDWPPVPPPISSPLTGTGGYSQQDFLEERARGNAAELKDQVTGSGLRRELGRPTEQQALPEDQSYRTVDGQKIVRAAGGCAQLQTVQGSPSPTNRINIAEPTDCPGDPRDASTDMGKALDDWAKKAHLALPPP